MKIDVIAPDSQGAAKVDGLTPVQAGQLVYADGVNWNPGQGAGWYMWDGSAFHKMVPSGPIWEKITSGAAVGSVTTNGEITLDAVAHGGYAWEAIIKVAANATPSMYVNGDNVAGNYVYEEDRSDVGNLTGAAALLNTTAAVAGTVLWASGRLVLTPDKYVGIFKQVKFNNGVTNLVCHGMITKNAVVTNVDRIDWVAAGSIGANSVFRIWRLR
jgi:hypothetical protein